MPVEVLDEYSRKELRRRPQALFAFSDNLAHLGREGQAAACRGEPNAVGIPTMRCPVMEQDTHFTDSDLQTVKGSIDAAFFRLAAQIRAGGTVVVPANGIGTDAAQLPTKAPLIHSYIQRWLWHLGRMAEDKQIEESRVAG